MKSSYFNFKKIVASSAIFFSFITFAYAWTFLLAPATTAVMWLGRAAAANVTMARAVEWSIIGHGAVLSWFAWRNKDDPAQPSQPVNATLVVNPDSGAKRQNPDSAKWNDASSGRDPTPKSSYSAADGTQAYPSNYPAVVQAVGGVGIANFTRYNAQGQPASNTTVEVTSAPKTGATSTWSGYVTIGGTSAYYYVYEKNNVLTCPAGYSLTSGNCVLQNVAIVQKPAGKVPCEVIKNVDGTWEVDQKNPECTSLAEQLKVNGKTIEYQRSETDKDTVTTNDDGGLSIETQSSGNKRQITTGPYSSAQGGYPITSINDSTGSGGGNNNGNGNDNGNGENGGGACGAPGLPDCSINDSGFKDKDSIINQKADQAIAKLDDRLSQIESVDGKSDFGIDANWIPSLLPGPAIQCQDIQWQPSITKGILAGLSGNVTVNWCDKADLIREFFAWLFGFCTVVGIAMIFFGSNGSSKTK